MRTAPDMAAAPGMATSASRVSAQISRRVDIAGVLVETTNLPTRIADQGESRVNLIWDRRLVQEDPSPAQDTGATHRTPHGGRFCLSDQSLRRTFWRLRLERPLGLLQFLERFPL